MGKEVLLVAPWPFAAPIDYADILLQYNDSTECAVNAFDWIYNNLSELEVLSADLAKDAEVKEKKLNLLRLGIGNEIAESERIQLLSYFVEFNAYFKAKNKDKSIFIGRKGTGKSALFIKLEDEFEKEEHSYNVILKPDSYDLYREFAISRFI